MQIGPDQGMFMRLLGQITGAVDALEVGTFTGYSRSASPGAWAADGRLLCCDVNEECAAAGPRVLEAGRPGRRDRAEDRPAADTLRGLPQGTQFDLAFIDADKTGYVGYWELILPLIRPGGLILADNTLSSGRVADADADAGGDNVRAIRQFNDLVRADDRVEVVLLPVGDGLTMARKL